MIEIYTHGLRSIELDIAPRQKDTMTCRHDELAVTGGESYYECAKCGAPRIEVDRITGPIIKTA